MKFVMAWRWVENDSSERPAAIDETSSMASVFVRRNFVRVPAQEDPNDPEMTRPEHWRFEQEIAPKEEWSAYYNTMINSANIDFIAMEVGVDLDGRSMVKNIAPSSKSVRTIGIRVYGMKLRCVRLL